jgi:hypothetical protein
MIYDAVQLCSCHEEAAVVALSEVTECLILTYMRNLCQMVIRSGK